MPGRRREEPSGAALPSRRGEAAPLGPPRGPHTLPRGRGPPEGAGGWKERGGAGTGARLGQRGKAKGREVVTGCRAVKGGWGKGWGEQGAEPGGDSALALPPRRD